MSLFLFLFKKRQLKHKYQNMGDNVLCLKQLRRGYHTQIKFWHHNSHHNVPGVGHFCVIPNHSSAVPIRTEREI